MNLVIIHWHILSYFFLILLFLLVSIILTVIIVFSAFFFDCQISQMNPGTFGAALTFRCSRVSESSLLLSSSIFDWMSASQSFLLLFGLSKSPFQLSQFSVSEMLSGELSLSLLAGWWSIGLIERTFNSWVRPPGRSFADKAGGTGDSSATTLVSVRNTRVFRTALTALTEPLTPWQKIVCFPSPRRRVRVYWTDVVAFRCTWDHLRACWITVEQSGKNIFFGNPAGAPGNHSYYLLFNDFQNLCIQIVFSSMYLCIYIATNLHTIYLDWQHAVIVSNSRCSWGWRSSELRDTLRGRDQASLETQLETKIEWTQGCTGRPWLSEFGDALWGCDWANLQAVMVRVWRCTRRR